MATGSGWQQQQYYCPAAASAAAAGPGSKFSAPSSASSLQSAGIAAMEYTQDLHLKMSKKIAQLTKSNVLNAAIIMKPSPPAPCPTTDERMKAAAVIVCSSVQPVKLEFFSLTATDLE
ncbi:hypothetical protein F2P81_024480 [Scophthalmus maximus]|uniref:Uncharacterized protein n=1 Tax=Scophthalmus maximus TaxID=52904 RepID=A0A6A4RX02_SCOMX|nr:hypothetical protein F2P81_024480 [Scophthalmus maximus]